MCVSRYRDEDEQSGLRVERTPEHEGPLQREELESRPKLERDDVQARDFGEDKRSHRLDLPRGDNRELVRDDGRTYRLRGSEVDLLERVGRFRAVFTDDARAGTDSDRFRVDVQSLERQGLIEERSFTRLKDGRVADVLAVTPAGKSLLEHHRDPDDPLPQEYYGGWVKPREVWHDASLYRMCREVESELKEEGASILRVMLDDQLKGEAFHALHEERERHDESRDAHDAVGELLDLHVDGDHFVFPDVRLEIEERDGTVRNVDLERVTEHYHRGHISAKSRAGFRMFGGGSSRTHGGVPDNRIDWRLR